MRDSIVLYRSTIEASRTLGEKARLKFLDALFDYAMDDKNFKEHPTGKQGFKSAADKKSDAIETALRGIK